MIISVPLRPHLPLGSLADDQPEFGPGPAGSDQHATGSEVLPLREPTPLQPQHRGESHRASCQRPPQEVDGLTLHSRSLSILHHFVGGVKKTCHVVFTPGRTGGRRTIQNY